MHKFSPLNILLTFAEPDSGKPVQTRHFLYDLYSDWMIWSVFYFRFVDEIPLASHLGPHSTAFMCSRRQNGPPH